MISLNQPCKKVVFEKSHRYFAALGLNGGVEVWSIKGSSAESHEAHQWDLNFKSVKDIQVNSATENQFFILMNSEDKTDSTAKLDTVLMFQFSRPQNMIMYWKFIVPLKHFSFLNVKKMPILLLIDKNNCTQKIYCGVSKAQLKIQAEKRRGTESNMHEMKIEKILNNEFNGFDDMRKLQHDKVEDKTLSNLMDNKSNQIRRLDQADKSMTGNDTELMSIPSLANVLDEFTENMLAKPSQATNILDLQVEFEKLRVQNLGS